MKTITIKELKNKELLPKNHTINNNKIFINNEIKSYMLYFKYKNSPPQNFWHEFFKSENEMLEFLESQKPFLTDFQEFLIIPEKLLTIEDHLKNQLQRDFNNLWLYSGDYSLDYNFDNKIDLWTEISEENYWDQLECLPPLKFNGGNFLIMEALTGNFHACLMKVNNRYFGKYVNKFLVDYPKFENEIKEQYNMKQ
jgi:hypothetical protein